MNWMLFYSREKYLFERKVRNVSIIRLEIFSLSKLKLERVNLLCDIHDLIIDYILNVLFGKLCECEFKLYP